MFNLLIFLQKILTMPPLPPSHQEFQVQSINKTLIIDNQHQRKIDIIVVFDEKLSKAEKLLSLIFIDC